MSHSIQNISKHILIDDRKVFRPLRHKIDHFRDVFPRQSCTWYGKKLNLTRRKHTRTNKRKDAVTENKHKTAKVRFGLLV